MKKRIIAVMMIIIIITTTGAYAQEGGSYQGAQTKPSEEQLYEMYMKDPQFQIHYSADPEGAMEWLERTIEETLSSYGEDLDGVEPAYAVPNHAYVFTTLVKQSENYNCGCANMLMAINGMGKYSSIAGSSNTAKQATLKSQLGSSGFIEGVGAVVYRVAEVLNQYTGGKYNYSYVAGSSITESAFRQRVYNSLTFDRAPLLHAWTQPLSYYNGHGTTHYITVTDMNYDTNKITLYDSHPSDTYYGIHEVSFSEAYRCVKTHSGKLQYLICYWP